MSRQAGSRAERQAQTREKLISVARTMFLEDGYAATSLDKVAEAAGFSKGAVYSNFAGKDELCLAVLDTIHAEQLYGVVSAVSEAPDLDARINAFTNWIRKHWGNPRVTALEAEFGAAARSSAFLAEQLLDRHRQIRDEISKLLKSVIDESDLAVDLDPDKSALTLLSLSIGVGAMRAFDPHLDVDIIGEAMRALLRGVTRAEPESVSNRRFG